MKTIIAVAAAILSSASVAAAADLAMKPTPYAAPAPVSTWTGCYIGAHGGAGVLHDQGFQEIGLLGDRHGTGGLAGGQIGCNYQSGMLVVGIEGEGFWSGMRVNVDQFSGSTLVLTQSIKNKWDYDVAFRMGVA